MASKVKDAVVWYQKKVRSCFYGDVLSLSLVVLQHHVCGSVTLDFFFLFCFVFVRKLKHAVVQNVFARTMN